MIYDRKDNIIDRYAQRAVLLQKVDYLIIVIKINHFRKVIKSLFMRGSPFRITHGRYSPKYLVKLEYLSDHCDSLFQVTRYVITDILADIRYGRISPQASVCLNQFELRLALPMDPEHEL